MLFWGVFSGVTCRKIFYFVSGGEAGPVTAGCQWVFVSMSHVDLILQSRLGAMPWNYKTKKGFAFGFF